ncbi:MAG: VTT domain-containing protein [Xanthomonadales bacterium]|nr:VTT domain-containing protein [Xanthomonadales bacterium]
MDAATLDALVQWLGENPLLAGGVIFLVAFCDAVVILGIAVPALPILFGVGTLVGLGHISGPYAVIAASLGAFCGDGISYVFGRHYGERLKGFWPFSKHPDWLDSGERFFRRHGLKGIVIARYVGAVRPFVPAIAGMLRMPLKRYAPASLFASFTWGLLFIVPGWIFGASLDLLAAVAGRLITVLGLLAAVLAAIFFVTGWLYRLLAPRTATLVERALAWSYRHPVIGRATTSLIDPNRPESASLLFMALLLIAAGWAFFTLLLMALGNGDPLSWDLAVHQTMFELRSPLADHLMASIADLGDWQVVLPTALAVFGWLLWRRRHIAAMHWLAAIAFGAVLPASLGYLLDMPLPPAALTTVGFSFPSAPLMMVTVLFGFFAVLVARELPGRRRGWPYVIAGLAVSLVGFARLYLGAHWLSDVIGGALLGMVWIAIIGLAYRSRVLRSFWVRPVTLVFFSSVALFGIWHGSNAATATLERFRVPLIREPITEQHWWHDGWQQLPDRRNELRSRDGWPLNVQFAGGLEQLRRDLGAAGWQVTRTGGWVDLLRSLDADATPENLPLLPASHNGRPDALVMSRPGSDANSRYVLRLWPSRLQLADGAVPVWQGTIAAMQFEHRLSWLSVWLFDADRADDRAARQLLREALPDYRQRRVIREENADGERDAVLLLRQL